MLQATTSFRVDNVWYEMRYDLCRAIQRELGGQVPNRKIVAHIHANLERYSITEAWNGIALFVHVGRR